MQQEADNNQDPDHNNLEEQRSHSSNELGGKRKNMENNVETTTTQGVSKNESGSKGLRMDMGKDIDLEADAEDQEVEQVNKKDGILDHGFQELTLSYLCTDKSNNKGKELAHNSCVERDFLQFKEDDETNKNKKLRTAENQNQTLQLSLALPSTSPRVRILGGGGGGGGAGAGGGGGGPARSIQSMSHTNHTRTSSDGFTTSMDFSQSFAHNPSCSLTQNSGDNNYEYSVGSYPNTAEGWQLPEVIEPRGNGGGVPSMSQQRMRDTRDITLYQRVLQPGERSNGSWGFERRQRDWNNGGDARQFSFGRDLPERSVFSSPSQSVGSWDTKSLQHYDKHVGNSDHSRRRDVEVGERHSDGRMIERNSDGRMIERNSDPSRRRDVEIFESNSDPSRRRDVEMIERILHEVVSEPVATIAQRMQELPENFIEDLVNFSRGLVSNDQNVDQLGNYQRILERRGDLNAENLRKSHRIQLLLLVALKTGLVTILGGNSNLQSSELVEIYLDQRCRNLACKSVLPVDDCECKICTQKPGFCSSCMCLVCQKFDCASETCSWVGCDVCLHWCHTDCGLNKSFIKPSASIRGAQGTTEMQFHCVGCDHFSELYGFVKEVFQTCAKKWSAEILAKELDCVKRIFQGSEDWKGKQLHDKASEMLAYLRNKSYTPQEVCSNILQFLSGDHKNPGTASFTQKEIIRPNKKEEPSDQFGVMVRESVYKINSSSREKAGSKTSQMNDVLESGRKMDVKELPYGRGRNKGEVDELESIVRMKQAEAQMFQTRADDARREAEGLRRIVLAKSEKLEEEYASKLARLCLTETEDRRRQKVHELQLIETAHRDYYNMKLRMETDIKELLRKIEFTRHQFLHNF